MATGGLGQAIQAAEIVCKHNIPKTIVRTYPMARGLQLYVAMEPRLFKIALVAVVMIAVVGLSAFPKEHGTASYQSVNGPTTVFEAARAALLLASILMAAGSAMARHHMLAMKQARVTGHADPACPIRQ